LNWLNETLSWGTHDVDTLSAAPFGSGALVGRISGAYRNLNYKQTAKNYD